MQIVFIWPDGNRRDVSVPPTVDGKPTAVYEITLPAEGPIRVENRLLDAAADALERHNKSDPAILAAAKVTIP